jgi:hypothetical protein
MSHLRLSGVQKEVLALYRAVLRQALRKDRDSLNNGGSNSFLDLLSNKYTLDEHAFTTTSYASQEFRKQASSVKRSEFKRIEYMIRKGQKQIKLMQMPGVHSIHGIA